VRCSKKHIARQKRPVADGDAGQEGGLVRRGELTTGDRERVVRSDTVHMTKDIEYPAGDRDRSAIVQRAVDLDQRSAGDQHRTGGHGILADEHAAKDAGAACRRESALRA
jgi:hypothetical protein